MKPQLDKLKDLLQDGRQKAQGAEDSADNAVDEADLANKVRDQQQPFTNFCLKIVVFNSTAHDEDFKKNKNSCNQL